MLRPWRLRSGALVLVILLSACASNVPGISQRIAALPAADVILLGEQHDAPEHQALQRAAVTELAHRGQLAALALEMADQGMSTKGLPQAASETEVQQALAWNSTGWDWAHYGPVVMAAVRRGVPVLGANLPRSAMRSAMADTTLDQRLTASALEQQRDAIRSGHCDMLPQSQIAPMARIQIARDAAMASTVVAAVEPGKTVLLIAGGAHVLRELGVPVHLPASLRSHVVLAVAGESERVARGGFDTVWRTAALAPKDYCAGLKLKLQP